MINPTLWILNTILRYGDLVNNWQKVKPILELFWGYFCWKKFPYNFCLSLQYFNVIDCTIIKKYIYFFLITMLKHVMWTICKICRPGYVTDRIPLNDASGKFLIMSKHQYYVFVLPVYPSNKRPYKIWELIERPVNLTNF